VNPDVVQSKTIAPFVPNCHPRYRMSGVAQALMPAAARLISALRRSGENLPAIPPSNCRRSSGGKWEKSAETSLGAALPANTQKSTFSDDR